MARRTQEVVLELSAGRHALTSAIARAGETCTSAIARAGETCYAAFGALGCCSLECKCASDTECITCCQGVEAVNEVHELPDVAVGWAVPGRAGRDRLPSGNSSQGTEGSLDGSRPRAASDPRDRTQRQMRARALGQEAGLPEAVVASLVRRQR
ncbi:unnamed protein product [Prorocentrum cordatum]|uniref:SREBP regulating gene protein n=1 Tax=Prorocentrum cordatum TaxID=2364126 RepID=A0ABN9Q4I8_9DINO|nr:unnamed protein product [Polarella glacialis]|mmetsp:Transcript_28495/g.74521  ORF Transcript_28495/g.74521 Transcript_28495/m.74521 type:complete len:154 (+) Transcript_28495:130-591(+)